jgi:hypothetical protein
VSASAGSGERGGRCGSTLQRGQKLGLPLGGGSGGPLGVLDALLLGGDVGGGTHWDTPDVHTGQSTVIRSAPWRIVTDWKPEQLKQPLTAACGRTASTGAIGRAPCCWGLT